MCSIRRLVPYLLTLWVKGTGEEKTQPGVALGAAAVRLVKDAGIKVE